MEKGRIGYIRAAGLRPGNRFQSEGRERRKVAGSFQTGFHRHRAGWGAESGEVA
jgi:hypothetical protein